MTETGHGPSGTSAPSPAVASPPSQTPTAPLPARKICPVCGEEIAATARKCVHCGSELNWRRHMSLSTTTLALLTAFIAVVGAVGPSIKSLFDYRDAFLNFAFVGAGSLRTVQDGRITSASVILLGSNEGHAAGGLVAARLQISWVEGGRRHLAYALLRTPADEPIIIAPGASLAIRLLFDPTVDPEQGTSAANIAALIVPKTAGHVETSPLWNANCSIGLTIADASTDTKDILIPARCGPMMPAIVQAIRSPGIGL